MSRRICLLMGVLIASSAWAQGPGRDDAAYPTRHLRLIAPFTGGSTLDIMARLVAEQLTGALGQNVVVDNRPGANGIIGIDLVAKAPADGYTMLITTGSFTGNLVLNRKLPYDGVRDFAPITQIARSYGMVLVVNPSVAAKSVKELVALAKSRPGKLSYGSSGVGNITHLVAEMFGSIAGIEFTFVPYRGGSEPMKEVMAGRLDVAFEAITSAAAQIQAGKLRALAVTSATPSSSLPSVPTAAQVLPGFESTAFMGIAGPPGLPRPIVERMNSEVRRMLALPDVRQRFADWGGQLSPSSPEEMHRHIESEIARWKSVAEARKIAID